MTPSKTAALKTFQDFHIYPVIFGNFEVDDFEKGKQTWRNKKYDTVTL